MKKKIVLALAVAVMAAGAGLAWADDGAAATPASGDTPAVTTTPSADVTPTDVSATPAAKKAKDDSGSHSPTGN